MNNFTNKIEKTYYGWTATSELELGKIEDKTLIFKVSTTKNGTIASCVKRKIEDNFTSDSFMLFGDYSEPVSRIKVARATEKSIQTAHDLAMQDIQSFLDDAKKQYNIV